jgi:two-component system, LytTR family, response regulator
MIKVIIIDDEPLARTLIREYLAEHPEFEIVKECNDGFEGVKAISEVEPQLVFLDVQMPKLNGFEMLELAEPKPSVIFTTAFDEYAMKAFDNHAIDYLLKPFSKERFNKAIEKWLIHNQKNAPEAQSEIIETIPLKHAEEQHRIAVRFGNKISIIPTQDIFYIEAYDDYVKIFTEKDYFLKKQTMSYYEQTLSNSDFIRVHRSFIVNIKHITRVEPYEKSGHVVLLKNGKSIQLSRSGYGRLREVLGI